MSTEKIIAALGVTAEAMGQQISPAGLLMMADDLEQYPVNVILNALTMVRRECRRLTIADVIDRIISADNRPKPDEAWANALAAIDESESVVWTQEAAQAFEIARPLLELNDKTGARMAFRDAYERLCKRSRETGEPARWTASLGWDVERRTVVLKAAVEAGRLDDSYARGLLPPPKFNEDRGIAILALVSSNGVLEDSAKSAIDKDTARQRIADIKALLSAPKKEAM